MDLHIFTCYNQNITSFVDNSDFYNFLGLYKHGQNIFMLIVYVNLYFA